jgi:hypothetical protein
MFNFVWAAQILVYSSQQSTASYSLLLLVVSAIDMSYRLQCTVFWGRLAASTVDINDRSGRLEILRHAD